MNPKPDKRPLSPYMLGPYYKFQITSLLSITSRLTGVFLTVVTAPLAIAWVISVALGQGAYDALAACLASIPGQVLVLASLFSLCYHLCNGIRHLVWDTAHGLSMAQIRGSGWTMLLVSALLAMFTWWSAS